MTTPITRFAPSPTGHLHIGGARTALFCAAYAHGRGGRFVLRIEDTDQKRSSEAAAAGILEDLAWLGIVWDDGPSFGDNGGDPRGVGSFYQSERLDIYNAAFDRLIASGMAYPCFDTPEELAEMRKAAEARKESFVYRQRPDYNHAEALARAEKEEHVLRFKMPAKPVTVKDEILGEVVFPYEELDDLVIRKRDAFPTYHFAVVVDDEAMGVTHVIRGQEHLNNTPRHIGLIEALGYRLPVFAHLPLIFNPDGSKMSKRDKDKAVRAAVKEAGTITAQDAGVDEKTFATWQKDKSVQLPQERLVPLAGMLGVVLPEIEVEDFRRSGYLPEAIVNYIALLGWNPGTFDDEGRNVERFDRAFLDTKFGFDRVGKGASKFDREKLRAFNFDLIKSMDPDAFAKAWRTWAERYDANLSNRLTDDQMLLLSPAVQPRAVTLSEAREPIEALLLDTESIEYDQKAVENIFSEQMYEKNYNTLASFTHDIKSVEFVVPDEVDKFLSEYCKSHNTSMKDIAQPIRVAVTGVPVTPPLGITLAFLGHDDVVARLERVLEEHKKNG